jgi:hypothetical protein
MPGEESKKKVLFYTVSNIRRDKKYRVILNFQTGNNNIKLLTKYESVIEKVVLLIESILLKAKELQHACLSWYVSSFVSGLKIIGHGNPDNNLE